MDAIGRTLKRPLGSIVVACALACLARGCGGTEGPLVVRYREGSAAGAAGAAGAVGAAGRAGSIIGRPSSDVRWQVQLSGRFDATVEAALYYVDLDNLASSELLALTRAERHVACYLSAGTYEPWRSDAASFPETALGNALAQYPKERWIDIRASAVAVLMHARLDRMKSAGCSSAVIANVTTSGEDPGFDLTATEQSSYLLGLSEAIHQRGLTAGLATAEDRLVDMEPAFDWAYAQGCWRRDRCQAYTPFVVASKAVLAVEFGDSTTSAVLCQGAPGSGINLIVKPEDLGASRIVCLP